MSGKTFFILFMSLFLVFNYLNFGKTKVSSSLFGDVKARNIGPAVMSGRITDIDVVDKDIGRPTV